MILGYIELQGFGSYEEFTHWDVPMGITGIIGVYDENEKKSNGSGKSTMVSAITYALFGEGEYTKLEELINDNVRLNKGLMFVRLQFVLDGINYLVERGIKGKSSYLDFYTLDSNGDRHRVGDESTSIAKTQQNIINTLKMEYDMFSASGFFEQNKLDKFVNAEPSVRRSYTDKVFDLETWRVAQKNSTTRTTELKGEVSNLLKLNLEYENKSQVLSKEIEKISIIETEILTLSKLKDIKEQEFSKYEKIYSILSRITFNQEAYDKNIFSINKYKQDLSSKEEALKALNNKLSNSSVEGECEKYNQLIAQQEVIKNNNNLKVQNLISKRDELNAQITKILEEKSGVLTEVRIEKSKRLSEDSKSCPVCRQDITQEHISFENKKIDDNLKNLDKRLTALVNTHNELTQVHENYVQELESITNTNKLVDIEITNLTKKVHQKEIEVLSLKKDIQSTQDSISEINNYIVDIQNANILIEKELLEAKNQVGAFSDESNYNLQSLKDDISNISDKILSYTKEVTELKVYEKEYNLLEKSIKENKSQLKKLQQDLYFYELSTTLFKDIPTEIFKESISEVETAANDIIQRVIPTLQVKIWEDLDKKTRRLMISFISNGFERSYERLSGGEKTIANIGIRLGYSQVITSKANTSIDFIVLDEPFGALDEENRDLIKKIFAIMSQWFTQIIVISHDDSIENFPNILRIGKTEEGMSYILN